MSADFSRVRFDPLRDHSGIGIQQGRVWLDADFNEQVAITDRRLRAQVADLSPAPTVVSRLTPEAFEITLSGGKMSIGAGRMYVHGMLAENHGKTADFDPVLAEPNGKGAIGYEKQPYWPAPGALPSAGGPHLVYLDVWERELTHLTTPDLVESAVGVDTTIRTQTAWQVRVLPEVGSGVTCGSTLPKWNDLVAPSSARLTTGTVDVDPVDDPCEIPPGKGYRGAENQLYRVELHSPTQFKWSRENATIASTVAEVVSLSSLRLHSLGRDDVLRIKDNDWVEIIDDSKELDSPGQMRQVTITPGTSIINFSALPGPVLAEHLRVRKWDSGLITVPNNGSAVPLEHGITVTFTFAKAGKPHAGDYWVFAARATAPTPEESLEKLVAAPPRGIHHHYTRLALVTLPGTVQDCRPDWPVATGDGCGCEVCVTPEGHASGQMTVQDAITALGKIGGGTLTLCPGEYRLDAPIVLDRLHSLRIRGAGRASRLVTSGPAIVVTRCQDIALEDFAVKGDADGSAITLGEANQSCRLERLWLEQPKSTSIGLSGAQLWLAIRGCVIDATRGIAVTGSPESTGLLTYGLSIEDNQIGCNTRGIDLGIGEGIVVQHTGLTRITGNTIIECSDAAIVANGLVPQDVAELDGTLEICCNHIEVGGSGIVTGGRVRVSDNTVVAPERVADRHGIMLEASPPDTPDGVAHVLANKVIGFGGTGITVSAPMRSLIVKHNIVRGAGGGIVVQAKASGRSAAIDNNQILDLRPVVVGPGELATPSMASSGLAFASAGTAATRIAGSAAPATAVRAASSAAAPVSPDDEPTFVLRPDFTAPSAAVAGVTATAGRASFVIGIMVTGVESVAIAGNTVDGVAAHEQDAGSAQSCAGIAVTVCREARISGNAVSRVGHPQAVGNAYGIIVAAWEDTASIVDNIVQSGSGPSPVARPGWIALGLVAGAGSGLGTTRTVKTSAGMWTSAGRYLYLQLAASAHAELSGNAMQGGGEVMAVSITTPGEVVMNGNRCAQPGGDQGAIRLKAGVAVVQGNRVSGGHPSMTMDVDVDAASVIGNITTGGIQIRAKDGGYIMVENANKPWSPLNTIA